MNRLVRALGVTSVIGLVTACGGNPEPEPPAPQSTPTPPAPSRPSTQPSSAPATNDDAASRAREAEIRTTVAEMVFFDFDRSDIRADARPVLDRKARVLRDNSSIRIRVEGHADERGSTEYNLALGSRRAESVRGYLTGVGIAASRIETVSYGEGRPLEARSNEAAWARNRRTEFVITAGLAASDQ